MGRHGARWSLCLSRLQRRSTISAEADNAQRTAEVRHGKNRKLSGPGLLVRGLWLSVSRDSGQCVFVVSTVKLSAGSDPCAPESSKRQLGREARPERGKPHSIRGETCLVATWNTTRPSGAH